MGEAVIVGTLILVIIFIIRGMIKDKKNGKNICGGDCSNCNGRCH